MTIVSRLPALVLLVLVAVAAALLVAGWGIAVGIGVYVGLVLGFVAILAAMAIAQRAGRPATIAWMKPGPGLTEPDHALLAQHGRDSARVAGIDAGDLRRVIAVGAGVEAGGVRLELIAVELRTDGGLAMLVAHTTHRPGRPFRRGPCQR